jgi:hypothetical protein
VTLRHDIAKMTGQLRQQRMAIRQYLVELGLTPSARGRVKVATTRERPASSAVDDRFFAARRASLGPGSKAG